MLYKVLNAINMPILPPGVFYDYKTYMYQLLTVNVRNRTVINIHPLHVQSRTCRTMDKF
jgi:hypothetical protein